MGGTASVPSARPAVPAGKVRLCVAGFGISHHTSRAKKIATLIQSTYPDKYETWFYFDSRGFRPDFLAQIKSELNTEQQEKFAAHKTSPFCWLEFEDGTKDAKGGRDFFSEWALKEFPNDEAIMNLAGTGPSITEVLVDSKPGTVQTGQSK